VCSFAIAGIIPTVRVAATGSVGGLILERDAERALADEVLTGVAAGDGATVLVEGPAGVGKTTVLEMFSGAAAARGMETVGARATPVEQSEAWAVTRRLFDRPLLAADPDRREELLGGAAHNALPALGMADPGAPVIDPFTCVHGLYWLVANLAREAPLLICVDDIQWTDVPSARWLAHMASRTSDLPVLLLLARRIGEPVPAGHPVEALDGVEEVRRIRPNPLSVRGSEAVVRARLGDAGAASARACHDATGGNPFLLHELCKSLAPDLVAPDGDAIEAFGAEGVARSLRRRLDRLGPQASALAEALSVWGEGAELGEGAALAGLAGDEAAAAFDLLVEAQILEADPIRFRHPILRTSLYEALGHGERSRRHREVARTLHEAGAGPERVAAHLMRSDPEGDEWVVDRLAEAAEAAASRGASEPAAEYLRRALAEPPEPSRGAGLRFRHALARLDSADGERPIADLTRSVLAVDEPDRPAAALEAARALGLLAEHEAAIEVCASVRGLPGIEPSLASRLSDEMVIHMLTVGPAMWPAGADPDAVLGDAAQPTDAGSAALREVSNALVAVKAGRPVDVEPLIAAVPGLVGEFPSTAFVAAAFGLVWCDELETAATMIAAGLAYSRGVGSPTGAAQWSAAAAACDLRGGNVKEALVSAAASVEFNRDRPVSTVAYPLAPMIDCLVLRGELEEASAIATLGDERTDGFLSTATLTEALGRLALARGESKRAVRLFEDAGRRFDSMGFTAPQLSSWRSWLALALAQAGEHERGRELAAEHLRLAERAETARGIGDGQRAVAAFAAGAERIAMLRAAAQTLSDAGSRIELCRALVDLGREVREAGSPREAREPLTEAMALAQECGAGGLEEHARTELVAAGARPRRRALTGAESLTPAELRVAGLVADGATNGEVAQALFLSEKTVEGHLRGIFRKLGIRSRTEIAERLEAPEK
jgi:DNA-binding CsgD family transcriptional regulator/tetratricopeptide (TPR) repeat protein/energy-coupling factor transporter ATP-binding protein EcfA2